jgi:hypothetical protein
MREQSKNDKLLQGSAGGNRLMIRDMLRGPMFRLNIVVMSSLAFLAHGLHMPSGTIEVLQLPVAAMQVYLIFVVVAQRGVCGFLAPLTNIQRGLLGTLMIHMIFVSATSPGPSAQILVFSWIIHILFFVALISFFDSNDLEWIDTTWSTLGLTALVHVCAFMLAWISYPDQIRQMNLPAVGNFRHLTYFLTPATTAMAVLFITRSERNLSRIVFFAAATFFIIYTGSRAATIGVMAGLLAAGTYSVFQHQYIDSKRIFILSVVATFLIILSEIMPPLPWGTIVDRWFEAFNETGPEFTSARNEAWPLTMKAISQNWIWGYGPALQHEIPYQLPWPDRLPLLYQPHNIGLQLLLHWGVLGTLILALTILSFSTNVWIALRQRPALTIAPFAILVSMLTQSLVDGNLFYPFSIVLAVISFAYLEAVGRQQSVRSNPEFGAASLKT